MARREVSTKTRCEHRRPVLIYDGECGFCAGWVQRWRTSVGNAVAFEPFQHVADDFPQIDIEDLRRASHLVEPGGAIHAGARAIFGALDRAPGGSLCLAAYKRIPAFAKLSEAIYRVVARHRSVAMFAQRIIWGRTPQRGAPIKRAAALTAVAAVVWLVALTITPATKQPRRAGPPPRFGSPQWHAQADPDQASRAMLLLTGMAIGVTLLSSHRSRRDRRSAKKSARLDQIRRRVGGEVVTIELIDALRQLATVPKSDARFPVWLAEVIALKERRRMLIEQLRNDEAHDACRREALGGSDGDRTTTEMPTAEIIRWVRASDEEWKWKRQEWLRSLRRASRTPRGNAEAPASSASARAARMIRVGSAELRPTRAAGPREEETEIGKGEPTPSGAFASAPA